MDGKKQTKPANVKADFANKVLPPSEQNARLFYKEQIGKFTNENYDCESIADMSLLSFELMDQAYDCYLDEKALFVSFLLSAYQNAQMHIQQQQKDFLRFLKG